MGVEPGRKRRQVWLLALLLGLGACDEPEVPFECSEGQVLEAGECVKEACSEARWAELQTQGFVVAPDGTGDGSPESPFGSIGEALLAHPTGPLVLSAGSYPEFVMLDASNDGLEVQGRCSDLVEIDASGFPEQTALVLDGAQGAASLSWTGTTFSGGDGDGIRILGGAHLSGVDLRVRGSGHAGVSVQGSSAVLEDLVVEDTYLQKESEGGGSGVYCLQGAEVTLRRAVLRRNERQGILALDCALVVENIRVLDTQPDASPAEKAGEERGSEGLLEVEDGIGIAMIDGTIEGWGVVVERARTTGIALFGSQGVLDDVVVRDTQPRVEDDALGTGLTLVGGAHLEGSGYELTGNYRTGLLVTGASAVFDSMTITGILPERSSQRFGRGIELGVGADVILSNLYIADCYDIGLVVDDSLAVVQGALIERIEHRVENGLWGRGIEVLRSGHLIGEDIQIIDTHTDGISLHEASAELTDVLVTGTREELATGTSGRGIGVMDGSVLIASGITLSDNLLNGLQVAQNATVELRDSLIEDTLPDALTGEYGTGLDIFWNSQVLVENVVVRRSHQVGVKIIDSVATLRDVTIEDTYPLESPDRAGWGMDIFQGAQVTLERVTLSRNEKLGMRVMNATVTATDLTIEDTYPPGVAGATGQEGWGAFVVASDLDLTRLVISNSGGVGLVLEGGTTHIETGLISGVSNSPGPLYAGVGVVIAAGAELTAHDLDVETTVGPGVYVASSSALTCVSCSVSESGFASVVVHGSAELSDGLFTGSNMRPTMPQGGVGIYGSGASLLLSDSVLSNHAAAAVWLEGEGTYRLDRNTVVAGDGYGLVALGGIDIWDEDQGLRLEDNDFSDAIEVSVLLQESNASLEGNLWSDNGVDLRQQACTLGELDLTSEPAIEAQVCSGSWEWLNAQLGIWTE